MYARSTCNEASIIIIDECFKGRVTEKMPGKSISNPVYKQAGLFWPCPVLKSPPPFLLPRPDALYCFCFFCFCSISISSLVLCVWSHVNINSNLESLLLLLSISMRVIKRCHLPIMYCHFVSAGPMWTCTQVFFFFFF